VTQENTLSLPLFVLKLSESGVIGRKKETRLMARWRIPIYCELARQLVERRTPEWNRRPPEAHLLPASESRRKVPAVFYIAWFSAAIG